MHARHLMDWTTGRSTEPNDGALIGARPLPRIARLLGRPWYDVLRPAALSLVRFAFARLKYIRTIALLSPRPVYSPDHQHQHQQQHQPSAVQTQTKLCNILSIKASASTCFCTTASQPRPLPINHLHETPPLPPSRINTKLLSFYNNKPHNHNACSATFSPSSLPGPPAQPTSASSAQMRAAALRNNNNYTTATLLG
ncbi:hypothetical protein V8C26DRAFT_434746 [Trichoderma gracile]